MPSDDPGSINYDADAHQDIQLDYPKIEGVEFDIKGPYSVLAGFTRLITPTNPDPGEVVGNVEISAFDMTQTLLAHTTSDKEGAFVMAIPLPSSDAVVYGYIQLKKEGFPTIRQFDRPLSENWTDMRLRLLKPVLFDIPRKLLKQKDNLGYIQGSVYYKKSQKTIKGAVITASSGRIAYLKNGVIPDYKQTQTGPNGVFFVANTSVGPVTITVKLHNKIIYKTMVLTWPKILTQLGIPIKDPSQ